MPQSSPPAIFLLNSMQPPPCYQPLLSLFAQAPPILLLSHEKWGKICLFHHLASVLGLVWKEEGLKEKMRDPLPNFPNKRPM